MVIPLYNRLKKRLHVETAMLQDEVVSIVYELLEDAVLHGGTAVWRCYSGNRFSEDLDFYFSQADGFEERFEKKLSQRGCRLLKFKKTSNAVYSKVSDGRVEVRLEAALFRGRETIAPVARAFEKTDGSFLDVFTLSAEDLFREKMSAYSSRRLVKDFYDVYHLSRFVEEREGVRSELKEFLAEAKPPVDERSLKTLVFQGAVPSFEQMQKFLQGFSE